MSVFACTTAEQLLADYQDQYCELIAGEIHFMTPPGWKHGLVVSNLHGILYAYIQEKNLGKTFGAETGFLIERNPDTVRAPDFALILKENFQLPGPTESYWPGAPDFAIEVLSPTDRPGYVNDKIAMWLEAGCKLVWVVDPKVETVTVHCTEDPPKAFESGTELRDDQLLGGFCCQVDKFFK